MREIRERPASSGSQYETKRYASVASTASAADTPASVRVAVSPASTKPRPPGVIGIMPSTAAATYASRTSAGRGFAPTAVNAASSAR